MLAVGSGVVVVPVPGVVAAVESHEVVEAALVVDVEPDPVADPLESGAHGVAAGEPLDADEADAVADVSLAPAAVVAVGVAGVGALTLVSKAPEVVVVMVVVVVVVGATTVLDESLLPMIAVVVVGAVLLETVSDDEGADAVVALGPLTAAVVVGAAELEEASVVDAVEVVADGSLDVAVCVDGEGSSDAEKN